MLDEDFGPDESFPQTESQKELSPEGGDPTFIPTSESVGCGHEDGDHLSPFSNGEFPTSESGEGRNGS